MTSLRVIAAVEILGGLLILLANVLGVLQRGAFRPDLVYYLSSLSVSTLALVAGIALWRGARPGVRLSIAVQCMQVAWVSVPRAQFGSTLGPLAGLRITTSSIGFAFGIYGRGGVAILPAGAGVHFPFDITVNFLAFAAIYVLLRGGANRTANGSGRVIRAAGSGSDGQGSAERD